MLEKKIVTRFAPSPTGFMHIGGVRTALFAWLWAKKNKGDFILRIEDTDKDREVVGSIEHIIKSLKWIGINWDQGPDIGGPYAPYKQSERLDLYKKYAEELIKKGFAYPDPYTKEELDEFRKEAENNKKAFLYRHYRPDKFGIWDGSQALRFKTPEIKSYHWHDAVRGELSAGDESLDDFILIKSDGYPTYNFAHIIDDFQMHVTHIMRADEFISSTPKFLSLYEALDITPPTFVTLPPILAEGGKKKLGKRDGAKDILDYRDEGYLPEAMMNFLALLGWNPGTEEEIFTTEELIQIFDIEKIQHSGAQVNIEKLDWINKEHLKKLSEEEFINKISEFLSDNYKNPRIIKLFRERISKWEDVKNIIQKGELEFLFKRPEFSKEKLLYKDTLPAKITENLNKAIEVLKIIDVNNFTMENVKEALIKIAETLPNKGELLHPVRFALTGLDKSPDPFTVAEILGKNETLLRLQNVI